MKVTSTAPIRVAPVRGYIASKPLCVRGSNYSSRYQHQYLSFHLNDQVTGLTGKQVPVKVCDLDGLAGIPRLHMTRYVETDHRELPSHAILGCAASFWIWCVVSGTVDRWRWLYPAEWTVLEAVSYFFCLGFQQLMMAPRDGPPIPCGPVALVGELRQMTHGIQNLLSVLGRQSAKSRENAMWIQSTTKLRCAKADTGKLWP